MGEPALQLQPLFPPSPRLPPRAGVPLARTVSDPEALDPPPQDWFTMVPVTVNAPPAFTKAWH